MDCTCGLVICTRCAARARPGILDAITTPMPKWEDLVADAILLPDGPSTPAAAAAGETWGGFAFTVERVDPVGFGFTESEPWADPYSMDFDTFRFEMRYTFGATLSPLALGQPRGIPRFARPTTLAPADAPWRT